MTSAWRGTDLPNSAPRALSPESYDSDTELIMGMTREAMVRHEGHGFNSRNGQPVLLYFVNAGFH
jgi:hypothetical protein